MNACLCHEESLALMALGEIGEAQASILREHLNHCAGCRQYLEEVAAVVQMHFEAAQSLPEPVVRTVFLHQLRRRLEAAGAVGKVRESDREPSVWARLHWQPLAWVALVVGLVGAVLWLAPMSNTRNSMDVFPTATPIAPAHWSSTSMASYHRAANASLETLDELLSRQAGAQPSSNRIWRAWWLFPNDAE